MNRQVLVKAEQIARMVVRGLPLTKVCIEMGMSYEGLVRITRHQEYLQIEEHVRNAVVGQMDARLAKRAEMETEVEDAVPEALQVLLDNLRKKRDLRAALEVLDRDPAHQFSKASRTQPFDAQTPQMSSEALADAIKQADTTYDMMKRASALDSQKPTEA